MGLYLGQGFSFSNVASPVYSMCVTYVTAACFVFLLLSFFWLGLALSLLLRATTYSLGITE